jgi:hypothetical protein
LRTALRSASELALVALIVAGCGGAGAPGVSGPREIPFEVHGSTSQTDRDDAAPLIVVAADAEGRRTLERLAGPRPAVPEDRVVIGVFQGQQRTGGYSVKVERVVRTSATLEVRAAFASPPADAIVIQVLTSPAHVVSVARADVTGVDRIVLVDSGGAQRAEVRVEIR